MQRNGKVPIARFRRLIGVVLMVYWIALFISTHAPIPKNVLPPEVSDKTLHFWAYSILAYLLALWTSIRWSLTGPCLLMLFIVLSCYGAADELLQITVNRNADVYDWFADVCGAAAGLAGLRLTQTLFPQLQGVPDGKRCE